MNEKSSPPSESIAPHPYPVMAASGLDEISLPSLPGSFQAVEQFHAKDFGRHVAGAIERSLSGSPYKSMGPQQDAPQTLKHYIASAKGASLLDSGAVAHLKRLAKEFQAARDQRQFFTQTVRPFLLGLKPSQRSQP